MVIIAHRGNSVGPVEEMENNPNIIDRVYTKWGINSEVDLWYVNQQLFLGHDYPQYKIDAGWLHMRANLLWIHCKNIEAMVWLQRHPHEEHFNYFWHEEDAYTITSRGYIWAYPGKKVPLGAKAICVMPEVVEMEHSDLKNFVGVCTDYGVNYI